MPTYLKYKYLFHSELRSDPKSEPDFFFSAEPDPDPRKKMFDGGIIFADVCMPSCRNMSIWADGPGIYKPSVQALLGI